MWDNDEILVRKLYQSEERLIQVLVNTGEVLAKVDQCEDDKS